MKLWKERIIPGLIFGFVWLAIFVPSSFFGNKLDNTGLTFRIILIVAMMFTISCLVYELFYAFGIKKRYSWMLAIPFSMIVFAPFDNIENYFNLSNLHIKDDFYLKYFVQKVATDYQGLIFILIFALIFFIIELTTNFYNTKKDKINRFLFILFTLYFISIATRALLYFTIFHYTYWIFGILLSAICDIAAYIFGMKLGRKFIKVDFAPKISPKKSWEGAIGGYIITFIFAITFMYASIKGDNTFSFFNNNHIAIVLASLLLPIVSMYGDLYFSLLKRINFIKDYSRILKGHGGILDRLDSHIFVFFTIFFIFFSTL
ncbi:phosphatidate cytidylyltransferase [Mycoplasmopsis lipophila]|uniref:phosphatidate cytidylyltransferase n=1 Tax=Mycoplasmopsis lipophila TaxID=2117 RepID=UPI003873B7EB